MHRSRLWWLPFCLLLGACESFGDLLVFGPGLPKPAALPTAALLPGAVAVPRQASTSFGLQMVLDGRVVWPSAVQPPLRVSVVDVASGDVLLDDLTPDADGHFRVPLPAPVAAGRVLTVSARSDAAALIALVTVPPSGPATAGTVIVGPAVIGLGSTLVTKALLPKLAEAILTAGGAPGGQARVGDLMARFGTLVTDTDRLLTGIPTDDRLRQAIDVVARQPTLDTIDTLTIAAVQYSHLQGGIADLVDAGNQAVLANLREGGAILPPAPWQIGHVVIAGPTVRRAGYDRLTIVDGGPPAQFPVDPDAFTAGEAVLPVLLAMRDGLHNAPPPPPVNGGGGASTAVGAPVTLPSIVFVSTDLHANPDVFTMKLDGSAVTALTNDTVADSFPIFSPNGQKIAFLSNVAGLKLAVMDVDGSHRQDLGAAVAYAPSWSPDGTKLVYVSNRNGNNDLYLYDLTAGTDTRLTTNAATDDHPAWSPDGTKIAFASARSGGGDIYVYDVAGATETRLTVDPIIDNNPAWSPDSQWVVYDAKSDGNLWKIKPDGTGLAQVTNNPGRDLNARWSPDGQWIAFTNDRAFHDDVYIIHPDGTGERAVANSAGNDNAHAWTRDSATLVFVSTRGGQADVYRSALDGTSQMPVLTRPATEGSPNVF